MSSLSFNPLPLYYDVEGKRPVAYSVIENRIAYEAMAFPHLDEGEETINHFYVKNASMAVIEDFTVAVDSVDKEYVDVELTSTPVIQRLAVQEVYTGSLRWVAQVGVKAGPCIAHITVDGMLTKE